MSTYKHTVARQQQGGFSQSPVQTVGNASNPDLDKSLKWKDLASAGVAVAYGKKAFGTVIKAQVGIMGIGEVERALEDVSRLATYTIVGIATGPLGLGFAVGSDLFAAGVTRAVNLHQTNLTNERLVEERGTRRNLGAGGHYG